jgi:hypothetical protein
MTDALHAVMLDASVDKAVESIKCWIAKIVNNELPSSMYTQSAALNSGLKSESTTLPQVAIRNSIMRRMPGAEPGPGDRVEFLFVVEADVSRLTKPSVLVADTLAETETDDWLPLPEDVERIRQNQWIGEVVIEEEEAGTDMIADRMIKASAAGQKRKTAQQLLKDNLEKNAAHARTLQELALHPEINHIDRAFYLERLINPIDLVLQPWKLTIRSMIDDALAQLDRQKLRLPMVPLLKSATVAVKKKKTLGHEKELAAMTQMSKLLKFRVIDTTEGDT